MSNFFVNELVEESAVHSLPERKRRLGVLFWICVGWLALNVVRRHLRQRAAAAESARRRTTTRSTSVPHSTTCSAPTTSAATSSRASSTDRGSRSR